jgi:putative transposase
VRELAADGIPVAVTCRVLKLARQPYYRWLAAPISTSELQGAYLADALFEAHRDDPEYGYRLLADEVREAGHNRCDRTVWRICADNGWWSVFGKKRAKNGKKPGPPAHDDLVRRDFTASEMNRLWLSDITEHPTSDGKLYLCAIKDVYSGRIVGYSIADRMKSRLAVDALRSAVARRGGPTVVAGCVVHSDRLNPVNSAPGSSWPNYAATSLPDRWVRSPPPATTRPWNRSSHCCRRTSSTAAVGPPASNCDWRSSPGSNGPTTAADAKPASAGSPPSSTRPSTPLRSHSPPETRCHLLVQQTRAGVG